jgi:hypothetical protein
MCRRQEGERSPTQVPNSPLLAGSTSGRPSSRWSYAAAMFSLSSGTSRRSRIAGDESEAVMHRVDALRPCAARTLFLSCEPLLDPLPNIDLRRIGLGDLRRRVGTAPQRSPLPRALDADGLGPRAPRRLRRRPRRVLSSRTRARARRCDPGSWRRTARAGPGKAVARHPHAAEAGLAFALTGTRPSHRESHAQRSAESLDVP